jgi:hypothetical protein
VIDSWKHEVTAGLTMWGMEYTIAHSDIANKARAAHGMHYYVAIVLNAQEDMAFEVEFRAPCKEWPHWWRGYGELLSDELFLNWEENSPAKFQ